jgi:sigma-B regulation protein RsbU (phosphoserine phosphatase)
MSPRRRRERILVVDDDPGMIRAVERLLERDYELACVMSPEDGLLAANALRPDLAILDIRMPGMDGFELMRRLRADHPDLDVIFITGSMTEPDARLVRAIRQGAYYFIQKPFDRDVLQTLVERCLELRLLRAVADRELNHLRIAQARLLPQAAPAYPSYRLALRYRPFYFATGDYHDFFPQPDGSLACFVGDSTGHGPSACMLMATMRTLLCTRPEVHGEPGPVLTRLTRMLHGLIPLDLFMTAVYLTLAPEGVVRWSAAGQPPPLRITAQGQSVATDRNAIGMPLAVDPDEVYRTAAFTLGPGERLLVFTDGIVEARDPEGRLFGLQRLEQAMAELAGCCGDLDALPDALVERVRSHLGGADFEDDFTLLAIERRSDR